MAVAMLPVLIPIFLVSFILLCFYIHFLLVSSKYWSRQNVPHVKPVFLLGSFWEMGIFRNMFDIIKGLHLENCHHKVLGIWLFIRPVLLILDPELIKRVLIRDFNVFRERGIEIDIETEPLAGHLFMLKGKPWRNLRVKLTPTFTSGKMKMMFPTMMKCGAGLEQQLRKHAEKKEAVEVKDLMARFMTDVISSVAFGIETKSIENPNSEFRQFGRKIFKMNLKSIITNMIMMTSPALLKMLKMRMIPKDVSDFFINAVRETVEYREKQNVTRNDFLQLLIQLMRHGKLEDVDKTPVDNLTDEEIVKKFSLHDAAAQCFLFFVAGFEASSTALTFALYELALNPDLQTKLQDEIESAVGGRSGEVTYEDVFGMQYLDMVVSETFRKYPPVANLQRECTSDYYIPECGLTLKKGTMVMISIVGLQHDPKYYPNPNKFDPERFSPERKAGMDPITYLPFGEGPRNCIGNRFALMQIKVCLTSILRKFTIEVCESTPIPLVYDVKSFFPLPKTGVPLMFKPRA